MRLLPWCAIVYGFLVQPGLLTAANRLAVADWEARKIAIVNLERGAVEAQAELSDAPTDLLASADGTRLIALSRGASSDSFWSDAFRPTAKASATLIDTKSMRVVRRSELGWSIADPTFSADGKSLYVLSPGVRGKADETKPAELTRIDVVSGEVKGRIAFGEPADRFIIADDRKTGIVYIAGAGRAKRPTQLRFVDLDAMKDAGSVKIDRELQRPVVVPGSNYVYLEEVEYKRSALHAVSVRDRAVAAVIAGGGNGTIAATDPATARLFTLSAPVQKQGKADGELRVIKGVDVVASVPLRERPWAAKWSSDGRRLWLVGASQLYAVDAADLSITATVDVEPYGWHIAVSPDGSRAVLHHAGQVCCRMSVLDLANSKKLTAFATGSKGLRIAEALVAAGASVASYQAGKSAAEAKGSSSFSYVMYTPRSASSPRGPLAIRADGKFAYALDTQTSYVTIAEMATGERVGNIRVGADPKDLVMLGGGEVLAAASAGSIALIDTTSNTLREEVKLAGELRDFVVSPDRAHAVAYGKERVVVIDVAQKKSLPPLAGFKRPSDVVFLPR